MRIFRRLHNCIINFLPSAKKNDTTHSKLYFQIPRQMFLFHHQLYVKSSRFAYKDAVTIDIHAFSLLMLAQTFSVQSPGKYRAEPTLLSPENTCTYSFIFHQTGLKYQPSSLGIGQNCSPINA